MIGFLATKLFGGSGLTAGIFLVATLAVTGYVGVLKFDNWMKGNKIEKLELANRQLELDVQFEQGEVKACKARIDETNERIIDLKEDREARKEMFSLLQQNVDLIRDSSSARVADLESIPTPQNCEEAMNLLRDGLGERE